MNAFSCNSGRSLRAPTSRTKKFSAPPFSAPASTWAMRRGVVVMNAESPSWLLRASSVCCVVIVASLCACVRAGAHAVVKQLAVVAGKLVLPALRQQFFDALVQVGGFTPGLAGQQAMGPELRRNQAGAAEAINHHQPHDLATAIPLRHQI